MALKMVSSNELTDLGLREGHVLPGPQSSVWWLGPESLLLPQRLLPTELPACWAQPGAGGGGQADGSGFGKDRRWARCSGARLPGVGAQMGNHRSPDPAAWSS